MTRVLVTGGSGFVGAHLLSLLGARNFEVHATVRDARRLADLPCGVEGYVTGDLADQDAPLPRLNGYDAIVHLAARVHQMDEDPTRAGEEYAVSNVQLTRSLALAAAQSGVRRFVFSSSVKAIGEATPRDRPWSEESPCNPDSPYGRSKLKAEQALAKIANETELETVVLRLPLVYGPGVGANMYRLFDAVTRGRLLPIGAVRNRRSLVYVANVVDVLARAIEHPAAARQTFLLSDGEDLSTPELVRRIARALGRRERLLAVPVALLRLAGVASGRSAEIDRLIGSLWVDSSRVRTVLDWSPPFTVDQGLDATAKWFERQRNETVV